MTSPEVTLYTAAQLAEMLASVLHSTDNVERRAVEGVVVRSLATPANLVQLVNVLCGGGTPVEVTPSAGVRQLAAVLLRKKVFSLWHSLDAEQQAELRRLLLHQLGAEQVRVVRLAIAHIVTRLAKADASAGGGGWPELQQAIRAAVEDPRVEMRELSMVLVYSVGEVFAEENALSGLAAESVLRGLADDDMTVQSAAVRAAGMLSPALSCHPALYNEFLLALVERCLALLARHATAGESSASVSLSVSVLDLAEQLMAELSGRKYVSLLTQLMGQILTTLSDRAIPIRVRQSCGTALVSAVSLRPKFLVVHGLLPALVTCCVRLMAEDETIRLPDDRAMGAGGGDGDSDDGAQGGDRGEEDELDMLSVQSPCMIGTYLLSNLATSVPSKAFTAALLPFITAVTEGRPMEGVNVEEPLVRKAAMLALACLAEGNAGYLRRRVGFVLGAVRAYVQDDHPVVRESAAFSLSSFCERLQPEILTHHAELFPLLVPMLHDPNDLVRCRAADALDTLCENVADELEPYIPTVLPAVVHALGCSSLPTQKALCAVISSMAMTRCPSMVTFGIDVLELLKGPFAAPPTAETLPLRAQATETVGVVGAAIGKDAFAPYFPEFMHRVMSENFNLGSVALREQSFGFLANACESLREEFMLFLDVSIDAALQTIEEDTTVYTNKHLLATAAVPLALEDELAQQQQEQRASGGRQNDHHDDDDDDDDAAEIHMRVRTADVEEKSAAIHALGVFAEILLDHFGLERVHRCSEPLMALDGHFYPSVRSTTMIACAKLTKAAHGRLHVDRSLTEDTLSETTRDMIDDLVHQVLLKTMREDLEREVVAAACDAMKIMLEFFGPQCHPFGPDAVVRECIVLLRQRAACQQTVDVDTQDSDMDDEDYVDTLFDEADDLIAENHNVSWRDVVKPERVVHNVTLVDDHDEDVMDSVAEMLESLGKAYGPAFAPYAPFIMPLLFLYCDPVRRDAGDVVMGIGAVAVLLEAMGPTVLPAYLDTAVSVSFAVLQTCEESSARGNSCYLLRILIEAAPERFVSDPAALQQTLQALWSVAAAATARPGATDHSGGEEIPEAVDNAISATCSLVRCCSFTTTQPSCPTPLLEMLPTVVPPMLQGIPMRLDFSENRNALRTLVFLLADARMAGEVTTPAAWLPDLVRCVANVFASRTVESAAKDALAREGLAVFLGAGEPQQAAWGAARQAAQLSPGQDAALRRAGF